MRYKNIKNGTIIDIPSVLNGEDWELIEAPKSEPKKEADMKKNYVKKTVSSRKATKK